MNKMTYVVALTKAIEVLTADAQLDADLIPVVDRLTELKTQTEKRNAADRKPTKKQVEAKEANDKVADAIRSLLANAESMTVAEMREAHDSLALLTPQKVTAVIGTMIKNGEVIRQVDKRVARFSLAR